ncbi:hypothetical protein PCO31111_03457 [Pandoraea communis]|uniref:Phage-Barnase-EndoU-ColicinE5/D-RelE-like nuclease domain-containing protein n=1 Tax=Pandoraea communis TaxID=2508297 RepID=A0A5E4WQP3_9BURK|nr:hypothetical protein [Pandoraea communis]VVE27082.1 hypothetical protein PCO31111_03457 [Pandoraea communis]
MLTMPELRAVVCRGAVLDSAGDDGPVFTQYRHNAKGAIAALMKAGGGVAIAALYHPEIGDIDLRWGYTSDDGRAHGAGLAKLIRWHPEVLNDLQGFISGLTVYQNHKRKGEIHLSDGKDARAGVKLTWNGRTGHWLATAYVKKKASASKGTSAAMDDVFGPTTATPNNAGTQILGFETGGVNGD